MMSELSINLMHENHNINNLQNISTKNETPVEIFNCFVQYNQCYILHDKYVLYLIGTVKHSASLNKLCINILQVMKYIKFSKYFPKK